MKFSEKQLRQAAALAENYAMNHLPSERSHDFSEQFEHNMDVLRYRFANGTIKTEPIRMGWQYYTRRGVAAVLLGAILTCAAMPEAVIAGYQKFIEVVEQFVLDDARTVLNEYTNISTVTDFAADAEYLYYQGQEGEIYRRPLDNLASESERLQLMTVDENYNFDGYAIGDLFEQNGHVYLYYYIGGGIMGSGHQFRLYPDGTVENLFHGKYSFFDFGDVLILANETIHSITPAQFTVIDKNGERQVGDPDYFYRMGKADDTGTTLGRAQMAYWDENLYALAFRYGEAGRICKVNIDTGKTTPISQYATDNFELSGGKAYYACEYGEDGTAEDDYRVKHLYMLNVKNGKETYIGTVKWDYYTQQQYYEPSENGVYYFDNDTEELIFYNSKKNTNTVINAGAKVEQLYRQNGYVVAHFAESTEGNARLMVFDKSGTVYTSHDASDRATINENGVMIYRLSGTNQLVKAELR